MRRSTLFLTTLLAMAGGSCGGGGGGGTPAGQMTQLMKISYSLPAPNEHYACLRMTADQDYWITKIVPTADAGTHHTIFAIDPNRTKPDGLDTDCVPLGPSWDVLFASGIDSPELDMPDGVALHVRKGQQMVFNLHLFNASDVTINGTSSLDVYTLTDPTGYVEAESVLAGPVNFTVNTGDNQIVTGGCTFNQASKFFGLFPHMHKLGKHIRIWKHEKATDVKTLLWDNDYTFTEQKFDVFPPIDMQPDDRIEVECTYNNTTGSPVRFGDSTTDEMCFAITFRYPAGGAFGGTICPI